MVTQFQWGFRTLKITFALGLIAGVMSGCVAITNPDRSDQGETVSNQETDYNPRPETDLEARRNADELIDEAYYTIRKIIETDHNAKNALNHLKQARALIIAPSLTKGAFIVGAEGGAAVMLARAENGEWSYPGFFEVGAASFGLQVGAQKSELMVVIKTTARMNSILEQSVVVGAGISAAIGERGETLGSSTTLEAGDSGMISFAVNQGGFIGASIDGMGIWEDQKANEIFYETGATAEDIIIHGKHYNPHADRLRDYLASFPFEAHKTEETKTE